MVEMEKIEAKILGLPEIKKGKKVLSFPYKKVEGLLYYLLLNEKVQRPLIASLLWCDMDENSARKNLRNALYKLKKIIGKEIIDTPDRNNIILNKDKYLDLDLDNFLKADDIDSVDLYRGDLFEDFYVKNCLEFNDWLREKRYYYKKIYINTLKKIIKRKKEEYDYNSILKFLFSLIEIDKYDEEAYRELMRIYAENGNTAQTVSVYNKLEEVLQLELGIKPDPETNQLFNKLKNDNRPAKIKTDFIGREQELEFIKDEINRFVYGKETRSLLISGEAGIGKTALIDEVLKNYGNKFIKILRTNCYLAESNYIYKPWKKIFEQINNSFDINNDAIFPENKILSYLFPSFFSDTENNNDKLLNFESIQHQSALELMIKFLAKISKEKKLIIVFEDLQWCDEKSLELMKVLIHDNKNIDIQIIGTSRYENKERFSRFASSLIRYGLIKRIELQRLNYNEVKNFVKIKTGKKIEDKLIKKIYEETAGNLFFLVEILKLSEGGMKKEKLNSFMTEKSRDILNERISTLSEESKKLLNVISIPFDMIDFNMIKKISNKSEMELLDLLEELIDYNILKETKEGYKFTHNKLRDYIYNNLSHARKLILHNKIAHFLESELDNKVNERIYFSRLIYHYENAGNNIKELEYLIKEAEIYFHRSHELFPVINDNKLKTNKIVSLNQLESKKYIDKIAKLIKKVWEVDKNNRKIKKMFVSYLNMKSLYYAAQGDYKKALAVLEEIIDNTRKLKDRKSIIEAYQQMAGLAIQIEEIELISSSGENMYKLAELEENRLKKGIALRFKGIASLYKKDFVESEKHLNQALNEFENIESDSKKYTLGGAAIYNYLGEIRRISGKFNEALTYYERSIGLCEAKNIHCGLGVFYINAGQVYYELNNLENAEKDFMRAVEIFSKLNTIWGYVSIAYGYLSLINLEKNQFVQAREYLKKAEDILNKHYKRYWHGILLRIKSFIADKIEKKEVTDNVFLNLIKNDSTKYAREALEIFKDIGAPYEIKTMEKFINVK